ncbi:MAG TPA: DUF308 domain-containing protein [Candidatus Bathyarchaeia archaeon]|nr:DUF308 domain-containing protein [Candidatus Bathyarchaeia archaeon]
MTKVEVKTSPGWRVLEILGGLLVLALAVIVLLDQQAAIQTLVIVIAGGLIIGGLTRIALGLNTALFSPTIRALNLAGGIIAIVLGGVVLVFSSLTIATLIILLALGLLFAGALEVGIGVARHPPTWLRALIVTVGVLTVLLSILVILDSSLGTLLLASILALILVIVGVRHIVHGITGHHPVRVVPVAPVTEV